MRIPKNKIAAITIAIFFILSMTASLALIPSAKALAAPATPKDIPTFAFVNAGPNPAGVGQTVTIGFWLNQPTPTAEAQYGDRWTGYMLKITTPSGTTTTLGPFTADDTGGTSTSYIPTAVGNYTVFFSFPGQVLAGHNLAPGTTTNPYIGDYYEPSNATTTFTVQSTPVPPIPETPLPTTYWTRPIESVNDLWSTISGNWLGLGVSTFANTGVYNASGDYAPYTLAPTTAHILWTQPAAPGGQIGGEFGGTDTSQFYAPAQYEPKFAAIILDGVLYYEVYPGSSSDPTGWRAVNLETGQILWTKNTTVGSTLGPILRCGQTLDYVSPNQYGGFAYLWATGNPFGQPTLTGNMLTVPAAKQTIENPGTYAPVTTVLTGTTYSMYDAVSGDYILSIVNDTFPMTLTEDSNGDLIGYFVNSSITGAYAPTLGMWNSTRAILLSQPAEYYGATTADAWFWRPPDNGIIPWSLGIQWTAPLPTNINGVPLPTTLVTFPFGQAYEPTALAVSGSCIEDGVILMTDSSTIAGGFQIGYQIEAGFNINTGALLWITNRTETINTRIVILPATAGVYGEVNLDTAVMNGYSITTGKLVWGPISLPDANPYSSIGGYQYVSANGICYFWGFGGTIYAVNMATGAFLWTETTTQLIGPSGSNTPYAVWPLWTFSVGSVADGMLFVPVGHQYSPPMFRGANFLAINCTNGKLVWDNMGFNIEEAPAVSDGVLTTLNCYDNQIYAYGMGPSKTIVTAPDIGVTTATPITITGTVMDISAGSKQEAVAANFPNGLPCVSDASMTQFMEAVYEQQPMPTNITGVPVQIAVLDSNGNHYPIGTVTTDESGSFSITWTPIIPGNYTVYATFAGTHSYYGSYAEAHFYAGTPSATPAPTAAPPTGLASTSSLELGIAAVIIVIVIIGAVIILTLRRLP
jgi:outer membrane protein assembly factor BamB